jgi:hypothetical protein
MSSGSGLGVDDVDDVAVARRHEEFLEVRAQHDATGAPGRLDGLDGLQGVAIDHRDRVVLLVGDEDRRGGSRNGGEKKRGRGSGCKTGADHRHPFAGNR